MVNVESPVELAFVHTEIKLHDVLRLPCCATLDLSVISRAVAATQSTTAHLPLIVIAPLRNSVDVRQRVTSSHAVAATV